MQFAEVINPRVTKLILTFNYPFISNFSTTHNIIFKKLYITNDYTLGVLCYFQAMFTISTTR